MRGFANALRGKENSGGCGGGGASVLSHNFTPLSMFQAADWPVKTVILGLLPASALSWVVFIAKSLSLGLAQKNAEAALAVIGDVLYLGEAELSLAALPQLLPKRDLRGKKSRTQRRAHLRWR